MEVGVRAGHPEVSDAELGLWRSGSVHDHDPPGAPERLVGDATDGRRHVRLGPATQAVGHEPIDIDAGEVPGQQERRLRRPHQRRVASHEHIARRARHGLLGATHRALVRGVRRVDGLREGTFDTPPRLGTRLEQVVEPLFAQSLHLVGGEARLEGHLGQQRERRREPRAGHIHRHREAVPARVRRDLRAQALGCLDECDRVPVAPCPRSSHVRRGPSRRPVRRAHRSRPIRRHGAADARRAAADPAGGVAMMVRPFGSRERVNGGKRYSRGWPGPGRSSRYTSGSD